MDYTIILSQEGVAREIDDTPPFVASYNYFRGILKILHETGTKTGFFPVVSVGGASGWWISWEGKNHIKPA